MHTRARGSSAMNYRGSVNPPLGWPYESRKDVEA
jgi:hypothetical protein